MKVEHGYWEGGTENFTWERAKRWHEERSKMTTMQTQIRTLPLEALVFSQTPLQIERRKMRTKEQISDRAASIRSVGVLQPILVRPHSKGNDDGQDFDWYEVAAGEGRVLSAREAGLDEIPAIVRDLTDEQVEEIQLIENLQRDDVHELVEALGYETLLKHGHTVDAIAEKVGKSKRTIYTRLQLLKLDPATHEAFRSGRIDFSKALLIASLPVAVDQRKAGGEIADMTYVRAKEHIEREYMLRLADAPFDTADATLLKNTPACGPCPKRTGNQPELFEVSKATADICMDKRCFQAKCEAGARLKLALARENGQRVFTGPEAKQIKQHEYSSWLGGGWVRPTERCYDDPKQRTYAEILGKDFKPAVLHDPHDKAVVIEIVQKSATLKKLRDEGVIKPEKRASTASSSSKAASQKAEQERGYDEEFDKRLFLAVHAKAPKKLTRGVLEDIADHELDMVNILPEAMEHAYGWKDGAGLSDIRKLSEPDLHRLIFELVVGQRPGGIAKAAQDLKVDTKKIRAEVIAALKPPTPAKASKKKAAKK